MNLNPLFSITNENVSVLTNRLFHKRKEKFDMIVEPFQAILQICFLAFCPIGTKIAIQDNLLRIQLPSISQGIMRWYYSDNKDDLYYLFNVFRRFIVYYDFFNHNFKPLMNLILYLAKQGLNNLMITYQKTEKISLLHTLELYKCILDKPSLILDITDNNVEQTPGIIGHQVDIVGDVFNVHGAPNVKSKEKANIKKKKGISTSIETPNLSAIQTGNLSNPTMYGIGNRLYDTENGTGTANGNATGNGVCNNSFKKENKLQPIDEIFSQIVSLYTNEEYVIIYNTLLILEHKYKNQNDKSLLVIQGLNDILHGTFENIRGWINEKIAF